MRQFSISLIFLFCIVKFGYSQNDSSGILKIERGNAGYFSFVTHEHRLYTLNTKGKIVVWDLNILDTLHLSKLDTSIIFTAICKDKQGGIFIGTSKGDIYKLNPSNLSTSLFMKTKYPIYKIFFNSANRLFLIVPYALYDPKSKKYWKNFRHEKNGTITKTKILGLFWKRTNKYFVIPNYSFIDSHDRIWMTSSFGEFGGSLQIFDTKKRRKLKSEYKGIKMGLFFPKSVFEDNDGNIYLTSGLQHFGNSGEIYRIGQNRIVETIYDGRNYNDTVRWKNVKDELAGKYDGVFVGPGTYNKIDSCIYFASNKGIYKAKLTNATVLETPQILINPKLSWQREPLAIGVGMSIKKLEFTSDNKLIFLTTKDGVGIYHNGKLSMLK